METIVIAGIDTIVGANLAATLADDQHDYEVHTGSFGSSLSISGCHPISRDLKSLKSVREVLSTIEPHRVVFCGVSARSSWYETAKPTAGDVDLAKTWGQAATDAGAKFTLVSSDAIFTGPWMFHAENSASLCPSPEAAILRQIEEVVEAQCQHPLIVRANAFGWHTGIDWLEKLIPQIERGDGIEVDCVRHASPILATDLCETLIQAWKAGLDGIYHVGGAERVNPAQFVQRLADVFHLSISRFSPAASLTNKAEGFGCGETSLQTRKLRRALGVSLPILNDSLGRLYQQQISGYRDRIASQGKVSAR